MDKRPITLIVRLWRRDGDLVAEVRSADRREPRYFGRGADLLAFLRDPADGGVGSEGDGEEGTGRR